MKKLLIAITAAALTVMAACTGGKKAAYEVKADLGPEAEGLMAYITDYDTGDKIDSVLVGPGGALAMAGELSEPKLVRLIVDGNRRAVFVLEEGNITVDPEITVGYGTPLNDALRVYAEKSDSIEALYESLPTDSAGMALRASAEEAYKDLNRTTYNANQSNPVGFFAFLQMAYEMSLAELDDAINANPQMSRFKKVNNLRESLKAAIDTSVGKHYKDFSIEYNDSTYRLADYVGKEGQYTLVDFWASWCGPCIKETATIKRLNERWGNGRGLNVVGVAVWDEPANTLKAIEAHSLPWPQIINAGTVPTDLYGISSIPTILLIAPDGTIVSRGKQGAELEAAVNDALSTWEKPKDGDSDMQ